MRIELGVQKNGGVVLVSDQPLPNIVKRVEYYREQRLFMLVYNNFKVGDDESELMHYEVPSDMRQSIETTPNVVIISLQPEGPPEGYRVPLIKVGDFF